MSIKKDVQKWFFSYENQINRKFPKGIPHEFDSELKILFHENPYAYSYYRNRLFHLIQLNKDSTIFIDFHLLAEKAKEYNPELFKNLLDNLSDSNILDQYNAARFNILEIYDELKSLNTIKQQACFLYQSIYESDTLYVVIASLSELAKNGRLNFNLDGLRDRNGNLIKGKAISFIKSRLTDFPYLSEAFIKTFNSKLRNTIGHNNYVRKDNEIISRSDSEIRISRQELIDALYSFQEMDNSLINVLSYYDQLESISELTDCGILAIAFSQEEGKQVLTAFQLWCFYDISPLQPWLQEASFKIFPDEIETSLGTSITQKGPNAPILKQWFTKIALQDTTYLEVITNPISPIYEDSDDTIELDFGKFKVLSESRRKKVKYSIQQS